MFFTYILFIEIVNALKSFYARKWKTITGKLTKWNIHEEADSEDITIVINKLSYTYKVNNKEYESNKIGFGFPGSGSVLSIQNTLTEILKNAPEVQVYFSPVNPSISILAVGFRMYHFIHLSIYIFILIFFGILYKTLS